MPRTAHPRPEDMAAPARAATAEVPDLVMGPWPQLAATVANSNQDTEASSSRLAATEPVTGATPARPATRFSTCQ